MSKNNPFWHIAGIGAIGSIIAASFCRGQQSVRLLLKNEKQLENYRQSQLTLISDSFNYQCHPPASLSSSRLEPISYLICCTKAYDVLPFLKSLGDALTPESIIILIHNGIGVIEELKAELPQLRIISGITSIGGYLEKPYSVRAFLNSSIYLGATVGQFTVEEVETIKYVFRNASLECEWTEAIEILIWNKFAINCSINLLTTIFACKNGALMQHQELLTQLTQEIALVLQAYNQSLTAESLLQTVYTVIQNTSDNYSSMYKDIKNSRLTEIHYLNGRLVELAEEKSVIIPCVSRLLRQFYSLFPDQKIPKTR